jgi:hypothetical protein
MNLFDTFKFADEELVTQRQITEWVNHFLKPIPMSIDILQGGDYNDDDYMEHVDNYTDYINANSQVLDASRYIYNDQPLIKVTHKNSPDDIICYVVMYGSNDGRIWTDVAEDDGIYETLTLTAGEFVLLMAHTTSTNEARMLIDNHPKRER